MEWNKKNTRHMPVRWASDHSAYLVGPDELVINLTAQSLADEFLALSRADLRRIRTGLRGHQSVVATVFGAVTDSGGNVEGTSSGRALRLRG